MPHARNPRNPRTEEKDREAREAEESANRDLREVFLSEAGQRVLRRLHAAAGTQSPRFRFNPDGRGPNPIAAAFYDGQASVVLEIERRLALAEDRDTRRPTAVS